MKGLRDFGASFTRAIAPVCTRSRNTVLAEGRNSQRKHTDICFLRFLGAESDELVDNREDDALECICNKSNARTTQRS